MKRFVVHYSDVNLGTRSTSANTFDYVVLPDRALVVKRNKRVRLSVVGAANLESVPPYRSVVGTKYSA